MALYNFHGGCIGCIQQEHNGSGFCFDCRYFEADWSKPDLSKDEEELRVNRITTERNRIKLFRQLARSSAAVDRMLALQDQIRNGELTLADALKEIGGEPIERTWRTTYLVERIRVKMIQEQKNSNSWQALAEAVLREVAEWLRSEYPKLEAYGTAWANLLDNEANR